jgi:hypothetical protein
VVLGSLDSLSTHDGALGAEDRRELVTMAIRQGKRLKRLVEQLMMAAQVENGMAGEDALQAGRRAVVDAVAMMREAGATTELCHPDRRVRLELGGPWACTSPGSSPGRRAATWSWRRRAGSTARRNRAAPASSCACRWPTRTPRGSAMSRALSGNNRMNLAGPALEG